MAEILETLVNNEQLGKVFFELLGQLATSAALKANENEKCSSKNDQTFPLCKSVPISPSDEVHSVQRTVTDDESGKSPTTNNNTDSSLGRPRYQWHEPKTDGQTGQRGTVDIKKLYSVYVGHLPKDITEGELEDLFGDVGEVVNPYVFPPSNGHTYTYGFVRFYTLEEAENAVREKNSKVIGSRQINVELSSSTRRDLQTNSDAEDSKPLLQKEYPKVHRRSDDEEKQVIEKIKASLRRLNSSNITCLGDYNPEEVFQNIKSTLRMLINFPMALANPSADTGENKSSGGLICNSRETLLQDSSTDSQLHRNSCGEVANQKLTVPYCQTTSRLPSFALKATKTTGTNSSMRVSNCDIPFIEENDNPSLECVKSHVTNKVREFLDSSSGEDNTLPTRSKRLTKKIAESKDSQSGSSTDDERNISTMLGMKPASEQYTKLPTNVSMPRPERLLSATNGTIVGCNDPRTTARFVDDVFPSRNSSDNNCDVVELPFSFKKCSEKPDTGIQSTVIGKENSGNERIETASSSSCSSDNGILLNREHEHPCHSMSQSSGKLNSTRQPIDNNYIPTLSCSTSEVFEPDRISRSSRKQVNIMNQENSTISNCATTSYVSKTSLENQELTVSNIMERQNNSQNTASSHNSFRTGSHSLSSNPQIRKEFSIPNKHNVERSEEHHMLKNGEFDAQAKKTAEKNPSRSHDAATVLANEKGIKSPTRRVLAPSFSFPPPRKDYGSKVDQKYCRDFSKENSLESMFDVPEFDFGFKDEVDLKSPLTGPEPEPQKSLLDSNCLSDDDDIIKLKDQLNKNVLKLKELQQTLKTYPQRRRKRLPDLFDDDARGSELERQIHDAEILLQKTEESWAARSNERELAYEKEAFHSSGSSPILSQFASEIKKDSLQNEIRVTDLKRKILQFKMEQCRHEETKRI